jgi:hypothetical protein
MFTTKKWALLTACLSMMMSIGSAAQNSISSGGSADCPNNFVSSNEFRLCATNAFEKASFKELASGDLTSNQTCGSGYARLANSRLCVLDNKRTRVKLKNGRLRITQGERKKCGADYIRLPNHKACIHKRIGLTSKGSKLKFVQTAKLTCDPQNPESKSCKSKCAPGFFRSPELGMCINYNAALRKNVLLGNMACKNPTHWRKLENSGVCFPKMVLSPVENSAGLIELVPSEVDLPNCRGGAEPQITSMVFGPPSIGGQTSQTHSNADDTALAFTIKPVVYCMVRPRRPK